MTITHKLYTKMPDDENTVRTVIDQIMPMVKSYWDEVINEGEFNFNLGGLMAVWANGTGAVLVLYSDNAPVGFAFIYRSHTAWDNRRLGVWDTIYVTESVRHTFDVLKYVKDNVFKVYAQEVSADYLLVSVDFEHYRLGQRMGGVVDSVNLRFEIPE